MPVFSSKKSKVKGSVIVRVKSKVFDSFATHGAIQMCFD